MKISKTLLGMRKIISTSNQSFAEKDTKQI